MTLTRRLQVLVDDERYERLEEQSRRTGASIGVLVRRALDEAYPGRRPARPAEAAARLLEADPLPVADWETMEREIEEMLEPHERP